MTTTHLPNTSFRNKTLRMETIEATCVLLSPQRLLLIPVPVFILLPHMGCHSQLYMVLFYNFCKCCLFFVFCYSLFFFNVCLSDASMLIFVTLVHLFELLYSISMHEDTIIYLSPVLVLSIYSLFSHRYCCHQHFYTQFASQIFVALFCVCLYRKSVLFSPFTLSGPQLFSSS